MGPRDPAEGRKMFIVRQQGRLGNAMFQFAFAYALGRRLDRRWGLSSLRHLSRFELGPGVRLQNATLGAACWAAMRALRRSGMRIPTIEVPIDEPPHSVMARASDWKLYNGYFQSEDFFSDVKGEIVKMFKTREPYRRRFESEYRAVYQDRRVVAIHVRRTDYVTLDLGSLGVCNVALPADYYRAALERIGNLGAFRCIVVGDDVNWFKENVRVPADTILAGQDAATDFEILKAADVVVSSNSTFAWWGGYLNPKPGKVVYAPRPWASFRHPVPDPCGIVPYGWEMIDVVGS